MRIMKFFESVWSRVAGAWCFIRLAFKNARIPDDQDDSDIEQE